MKRSIWSAVLSAALFPALFPALPLTEAALRRRENQYRADVRDKTQAGSPPGFSRCMQCRIQFCDGEQTFACFPRRTEAFR